MVKKVSVEPVNFDRYAS